MKRMIIGEAKTKSFGVQIPSFEVQ